MQVRSLLSLFVDIETTDRSNAFYEKFNTRYKAGQILGMCLPPQTCSCKVHANGGLRFLHKLQLPREGKHGEGVQCVVIQC